ncbi:HK97 family phage prohead protease [Stenotrophomonas sp. NPDC078853]|uniref:HK97 family phage prohead protease n=1 Tax=Stenotrophomonas sp. NPDC078853 TaxID=3364534 RepID=UPI00384CA13C
MATSNRHDALSLMSRAMGRDLADLKRRLDALEAAPRAKQMTLGVIKTKTIGGAAKRTFGGVASTSSVDRMGDVVVPKGGSWKLPVPLLWQHDHSNPIGWVTHIEATSKDITVLASVAEGIGKSDDAWAAISAGLVTGLSIGFRFKEREATATGYRFTKWELLELSVVTIPANSDGKITSTAAVKDYRGNGIKLLQLGGAIKLLEPQR